MTLPARFAIGSNAERFSPELVDRATTIAQEKYGTTEWLMRR